MFDSYRTHHVVGILLAITLIWSSLPGSTHAGGSAKAKIDEAIRLFDKEDYPGALSAFEAAYNISGKASLLFNIAMCQKALFMYVESIETFRKYLAQKGSGIKPERKAEVDDLIDQMMSLVTRLTISDAPVGAGVYVNGKQVATCPLSDPILLNPGRPVIEVKKKGYKTFRTEVTVGKGKEIILAAALEGSKPRLRVECDDPDAIIKVNGEIMGSCPFEGSMAPGEYEVVLESEGKNPLIKMIKVPESGLATIAMNFGGSSGGTSSSPSAVPIDSSSASSGTTFIISGSVLLGVGAVAAGLSAIFISKYNQNLAAAKQIKAVYEADPPPAGYTEEDRVRDEERFQNHLDKVDLDEAGIAACFASAGVLVVAAAILIPIGVVKRRAHKKRVSLTPTFGGIHGTF